LKRIDISKDIYYSKEYASLYPAAGESIFEFEYRDGPDRFYNLAIKRPILRIGERPEGGSYFDLETAYGYGGYCSTSTDARFLDRAMHAYRQKCQAEKIIAEFVRFHPYNSFPLTGKHHLDFITLDRKTVSIDLSIPLETRWAGYSSTARNVLRRASRQLQFNETSDIESFMRLYSATMEKNRAESYYYFSREYYEKLLALDGVRLFEVRYGVHVINMSFILIGSELAHYHLSANDIDHTKLNGNYYLLDSVCDCLKENYPNLTELHLGGGRTNMEKDTLLAFKSKFSSIRKDFYIGGKVIDHEIYNGYVSKFNEQYPGASAIRYFLKYRMGSV